MYNAVMRVILSADGSLNIALPNCQTTPCTARSLMSFLSDPFEFYKFMFPTLTQNSPYVNPYNAPLSEIPGVTIAYVNKNNEIISVFHEAFHKLFNFINNRNIDAPIDALDILSQTEFTDQKQLLLRVYLELMQTFLPSVKLNRRVDLSDEAQANILSEIVNTLCTEFPRELHVEKTLEKVVDEFDTPFPNKSDLREIDATKGKKDNKIPAGYIRVKDYAALWNTNSNLVLKWINRKKIFNAYKDISGHYWIDPKEVPADLRAARQAKVKKDGHKYVTLKSDAFEDVQEYTLARGIVTEKIAPFIRTADEARYYFNHYYREVHWETRNALIIDIKLDYFVESKNMTNRELILAGRSPVVPEKEDVEYQLHHIGQCHSSPLVILPKDIHNGKETRSIFHSSSSKEDPVDHDLFEKKEKFAFWREYVQRLDSCGGYRKVPYENPRNKNDQVE